MTQYPARPRIASPEAVIGPLKAATVQSVIGVVIAPPQIQSAPYHCSCIESLSPNHPHIFCKDILTLDLLPPHQHTIRADLGLIHLCLCCENASPPLSFLLLQ